MVGIGVAQPCLGDGLKTDNGVHAGVEEGRRQHGARGAWRLGVRVRQPGVHRRETDLGAVADNGQQEGEPEASRLEGVGVEEQVGPGEALARGEMESAPGVEEPERRQKGDRHAERADDHVLPGRLERAGLGLETHKRRARERARLDQHPEQAEVPGKKGAEHA